METLIIKTQEELNFLLNNNQYKKNIPDIEKFINTFIIESSIYKKNLIMKT